MNLCKIKMPDLGEGMTECEIVEWQVAVGDTVKEDDVIAGVMTDKAVVEIPSPVNGVIKALTGDVGELVPVGTVIIVLEVADAAKTTQTPPQSQTLSAPAVKQRAKNLDIDLSTLSGSGPLGRILHQDLDQRLLDSGTSFQSSPADRVQDISKAQTAGPDTLSDSSVITTTPVVGLRRKIAKRVQDAKQRIPHITYVEAVDVTEVEALRAYLNQRKRDNQEKLSLLPLLLQAMTLATRIYPMMNAHYDDVAGELHQYQALHLGVATQTKRGLLVPVLRHAEQMDIWEAAAGIKRLATLARQGTLTKDELSGSTLTCSSLGKLGGLVSTPVINSPEICVIGVNKIQIQPVYQGGKFVPKQVMNLSSSFDHRIVDGYEAAQFVQCLREHLEHPAALFIEK